MDAIQKALKKFKEVITKIKLGKTKGLDIKKLQGRDDIFRVRKGNIRIIYQKQAEGIFVLLIERRNEKTYNNI